MFSMQITHEYSRSIWLVYASSMLFLRVCFRFKIIKFWFSTFFNHIKLFYVLISHLSVLFIFDSYFPLFLFTLVLNIRWQFRINKGKCFLKMKKKWDTQWKCSSIRCNFAWHDSYISTPRKHVLRSDYLQPNNIKPMPSLS